MLQAKKNISETKNFHFMSQLFPKLNGVTKQELASFHFVPYLTNFFFVCMCLACWSSKYSFFFLTCFGVDKNVTFSMLFKLFLLKKGKKICVVAAYKEKRKNIIAYATFKRHVDPVFSSICAFFSSSC